MPLPIACASTEDLDRLIAMLRARREELGWSREKVGRRVGVTDGAIGFYEKRDMNPKMIQMVNWAQALGYRLALLPDLEAQAKLTLDLGSQRP